MLTTNDYINKYKTRKYDGVFYLIIYDNSKDMYTRKHIEKFTIEELQCQIESSEIVYGVNSTSTFYKYIINNKMKEIRKQKLKNINNA